MHLPNTGFEDRISILRRHGALLASTLFVCLIFATQFTELFEAYSPALSELHSNVTSSLASFSFGFDRADLNEQANINTHRRIIPRPWRLSSSSSSTTITSSIPPISSPGETFASFLSTRLGLPNPKRPVWLVEADASYLKTAVPHLRTFLARLEQGDLPPATGKVHTEGIWADQVRTELKDGMAGTGQQDIIVLCLDEHECPQICLEQGILCYTEYLRDEESKKRPDTIKEFVWVKLRALIEIARAGYPTTWADGDVFFRNNPFEFMLPMQQSKEPDLIGSVQSGWDFQLTDEEADNMVNIGFFIQRGTDAVANVWEEVLRRLVTAEGWWDQLVFNQVLDIGPRRKPAPGEGRRKTDVIGTNELKVHVLDKERFRGYMLGFLVPPEAVFIHMPCADNAVYKDYIAATYGYFQDADGYYSSPPLLMTTPSLSGTEDEVIRWMRFLLSAVQASGRAFVPPMECSIFMDGTVHHRHFSSVFRIDDLRESYNVTILEPGYHMHAIAHLQHDPELALDMANIEDLDVRNDMNSFQDFLQRLKSPVYEHIRMISISHGIRKAGSFDQWTLPQETDILDTCANIASGPSCTKMCESKST